MKDAVTIWLTGISGSGKSTLAKALAEVLKARGLTVEVLNSGRIRREINRSMGFSREEIETNTLRLGYECKLLNRNGVIAIVVAVSPYREVRDRVRAEIGAFVEVYCRCSMDELFRRDKAGLFDKAMKGDIGHVAGINAPYEEPFKPEVLINTDTTPVEEGVRQIVTTLELLGRIERVGSSAYTPREEEMIRERLQDLGYL